MLDRKFILEKTQAVIDNCRHRGVSPDVGRLVELENQRKLVLQQVEDYNRQANEVAKSIGQARDDTERNSRIEKGRPAGRPFPHQREADYIPGWVTGTTLISTRRFCALPSAVRFDAIGAVSP